jgi:hypothetical protein
MAIKFLDNQKAQDMTVTLILFGVVIVLTVFSMFILNPIHKKNIEKLKSNKPIDRQKITIDNIVGTVESIHPWGRTEVVPINGIELEYFEFCDQWVMYGDVVQPIGRKGYFMPVMRGRLNLDVKNFTQTWIEYGGYETGSLEKPETYEDFRLAHIRVKLGKITNIEYTHYRLLPNNTWSIISSWESKSNETN